MAKVIRARLFYVHGCVLTGKTALAETNIFFSFLNTFSLPGRGCGGGSGGGGGGGGGMQVRVLHVAGCTRGVTLRTDPPVKNTCVHNLEKSKLFKQCWVYFLCSTHTTNATKATNMANTHCCSIFLCSTLLEVLHDSIVQPIEQLVERSHMTSEELLQVGCVSDTCACTTCYMNC